MGVALDERMKINPQGTKTCAELQEGDTSSHILCNFNTAAHFTYSFALQTDRNMETANEGKLSSGVRRLKWLIVNGLVNDKTFEHAHLLSIAKTYLEMVP